MTNKVRIPNDKVEILGIAINKLSFFDCLKKIEELVNSGSPHQVCTVNPEFIIHSTKNEDFKLALQESSLNTADGIGILWASKFSSIKTRNIFSKIFWLIITLVAIIFNKKWLSSVIPERVTGIDLMWELANRAQERGWKIYLLAWDKGRAKAEEVEEKLKTLYPRINIVGTYNGSPTDPRIVEKIAKTKPDIVFVAFGSPKQEIFIHKNLKKFHAKVIMGVGGSFDFISEKAKRAPKIFRVLGIEWLYRLICQPKRAGRIFNAFPRFVKQIFRKG